MLIPNYKVTIVLDVGDNLQLRVQIIHGAYGGQIYVCGR